jgi:uncharacterized membrane protein YphA (DoxX/SURF4 family)
MRLLTTYFRNILRSPWIYRVIRYCIGIVFIYAGIIKITDPGTFASIISQYGIVPETFLAPVAIGLPLLEIFVGFGLIFKIRGSAISVLVLLVIFVFVLWYGILNDLNVDCGCFSSEEIAAQNSLMQALYRDMVMIGALFFFFLSKWFCPSEYQHNSLFSKLKT